MKNWQKQIFSWSIKLHRWLMWLAIVLGGIMTVTGLTLEGADEGEENILRWWINIRWAREVHESLASAFALVFAIMIMTGLLMWLISRSKTEKGK